MYMESYNNKVLGPARTLAFDWEPAATSTKEVPPAQVPSTPPKPPSAQSPEAPRKDSPKRRCRWCDRPIIWGQITTDNISPMAAITGPEDLAELLPRIRAREWIERMPSRVGRFLPLDPDGTPHGCQI